MTDEQYESEPVTDWEYRNIKCALYCLRLPDNSRWLGYARIGDEWTEVLDRTGYDPTGNYDRMQEKVEDEVDAIIREAVRDEVNDLDWPPQPDPNPDPIVPDPNPNPNPSPFPDDDDDDDLIGPNPVWTLTNGTVSVRTTDGRYTTTSLPNIDADDVNDDGTVDI